MPEWRLTAEEIDARVGKPAGWTRAEVGVLERRECRAPGNLVTMGSRAIAAALADAGMDWPEVGLLIDCSTSLFRPVPCNAAHFLAAAGEPARGVPGIDVHSTCLGFIVAVDVANSWLASGRSGAVVIVASETGLTGVNWSQAESAALVGDGAAAVVLAIDERQGAMVFAHETHAEHLELCRVNGGAHFLPPWECTAERISEFQFDMAGPAVFRVARRLLPPMVKQLLKAWHELDERHCAEPMQLVPHQASPAALESVRRMLDWPAERFHVSIATTGNLAAAGIPLGLDSLRRGGKLVAGEPLMLLGTSAGYSQAAMIFRV